MKTIYGFKNRATGEMLFSYKTDQGTSKKAFFNDKKHAENAMNWYIDRDDVDIVELGVEEEENKPKTKRPFDYRGRDFRAIRNACCAQDLPKALALAEKYNAKEEYPNTVRIYEKFGLLETEFTMKMREE